MPDTDTPRRPWLFPAVWLFGLAMAACGWMAWSPYAWSTQEAWAQIAKTRELWACLTHPDGPQWWTPFFMGGSPWTTQSGTVFTSCWLFGWITLAGDEAGSKLSILAFIPCAAASMFLFARRASRREDMALIASVAYTLCPSLWFRALSVEHTFMVGAIAILPLVCWSALHLSEKPSLLSAWVFGVSCSFLALFYIKVALLAAPLLLVFFIWAAWKNQGLASFLTPKVWATVCLSILVLAIIPLLPSLREAGSAALFQFLGLETSQHLYSSRTALHFFDRMGVVFPLICGHFPATTAAGAYYPGAVPLLGLSLLFVFRHRLLAKACPRCTSVLRISITLALLAFWLSHGPSSVLIHTCLAWVGGVHQAPDFFRALLWLSLAAQGLVVYSLVPRDVPMCRHIALALTLIYLFVPGYFFLSWLPFYSDLRAPFDFYQITGLVWICLASGIACALWIERLSRPLFRVAASVVLILVWAVDFSGHLRIPGSTAYPEADLPLYAEVVNLLREDPHPGGVFVHARDHLYLSLPAQTGRPLVKETFQDYLQQRGLAAFLTAGERSPNRLQSLRLAGVAFVVVDRLNPLLESEFLGELHNSLQLVLENRRYTVFRFQQPLAPAYLGSPIPSTATPSIPDLIAALADSHHGFVPIDLDPAADTLGSLPPTRPNTLPYTALPSSHFIRNAPASFTLISPAVRRWIVVPEAWHPDWKATVEGRPVRVSKAFGAFIAIPGADTPQTWIFRFEPPLWVHLCSILGAFFWIVALLFGGMLLLARFRRFLSLSGSLDIAAPSLEREALTRPLAIVPTYNEAESLPTLLQGLLPCPDLHVLVVDDGSADGTAEIVKHHPAFGASLFLLERKAKLGLGSAYREGFQWAMDRSYDACLEIDADLSHNPMDVPRLLSVLNEGKYDAVIGSRYLGGTRVINWSKYRLLLSTSASHYVRLVLGMPLTDATSGFKALRVSTLRLLDPSQFRAEGYAFQIELHFALWKKGCSFIELPITFTERRGGHSKMSVAIAVEAALRVIQLAFAKNPAHLPKP
jgi:dolichol-phosphate mannosyltransferase